MAKKAPKQAPIPKAADLTQAQTEASRTAARQSSAMNNIDQIGPNGSVTFERDANGVPTRQVTTLAPGQQQALDAQNNLSAGLSNTALGMLNQVPSTPFGMPTDLPNWVTGIDESKLPPSPERTNYGATRDKYTDAMFARQRRLLDPVFADQERSLEQKLSDRGLPQTGEAYDHDMTQFQNNRSRAYADAADAAVQAGAQEESRLFGLDSSARQQMLNEQITNAGLANDTRTNMLGEAYNMYNLPLQQISTLLGVAPKSQAPNALPFAQYGIQPGDIGGNTWNAFNAQNQAYQNQYQAQNAMWNNLASIAGTGAQVAMMSDENMKEDIGSAEYPILEALEEMPINSWRYKPEAGQDNGEKHIGPMAQDFKGFFGLGDGKKIPVVDGVGVALKATQQLAKKVRALEAAA